MRKQVFFVAILGLIAYAHSELALPNAIGVTSFRGHSRGLTSLSSYSGSHLENTSDPISLVNSSAITSSSASDLEIRIHERPRSIQLGNGSIDLSIDSSVPAQYHQYLLDVFLEIYPPAIALYGPPAYSRTVTVHYIPGAIFSAGTDSIILGRLPNIAIPYDPNNPNDPSLDRTCLHELLHVFHDPVHPGNWGEEGMAEAGTFLIASYLREFGIRDVEGSPDYNLWIYDNVKTMGSDILGDISSIDGLHYSQASALFWMLLTAESSAGAGSWSDYDFFKRLNTRLMNQPHAPLSSFLAMINAEAPFTVDGSTAGSWVGQQAIASLHVSDGVFLGIYSLPPIVSTGPQSVTIIARAVHRTLDFRDEEIDGTVALVIRDRIGFPILEGSIDLQDGSGSIWLSTVDLTQGGYRIEATADLLGVDVTATNHLLVSDTPLMMASDGVAFISTSRAGDLLLEPLTSDDGTFLLNSNAGAVLKPSDIEMIPRAVEVEAGGSKVLN